MLTVKNIRIKAMINEAYADTPSFYDYRIRVLTEDVLFELPTGEHVLIKKGFEWDETTVPWYLTWAFPKSGKYAFSALIHDALYYAGYKSQKFADDTFYAFMLVTVSKTQAKIRWQMVRLFGRIYWNKNIKNPSKRAISNKQLVIIS